MACGRCGVRVIKVPFLARLVSGGVTLDFTGSESRATGIVLMKVEEDPDVRVRHRALPSACSG